MTEAQTIRQLERRLADSEERAEAIQKTDVLNDLAWACSDTDPGPAQALSETAYALASFPISGAPAWVWAMMSLNMG